MPDIVTGKTFVDGERGITATKLNQIISQAVIQPSFVTAKPSSSTLDPTDQLLEVKGAGTYATITGQQLIDSVSASVTQNIQPTIWSVRLRSFNAVGNPNFEVDQISVGTSQAIANTKLIDRWNSFKAGTLAANLGQVTSENVYLPNTNFIISRAFYRFTLTTQQSTLGASDALLLYTSAVEGPFFRELLGDVHSISLLVRSSVAGLKFAASLHDGPTTKSLAKLCTIPSANTWTLIQLPNLPIWAAGGNWNIAPGQLGYQLLVCLAAGSTVTAPANDVWQNGSFYGAIGQANFAASPVSSTFDIAMVQHEPGAQCTTLMDKPFTQNLTECLRYYCKSYPYGTAVGAPSVNGYEVWANPYLSTTGAWGGTKFPVPLAKAPTAVQVYSPVSGAAPALRFITNAADWPVSSSQSTEKGINSLTFANTGTGTANALVSFHYTADTGW